MPIALSHIGEDLIAEMLSSLAQRQQLNQVVCAVSQSSLADDIKNAGLGQPLSFRAEDATLVVQADDSEYACDGEQKVDVLCAGGCNAIALEAKLGETRMASAEFRKRFCTCCVESKHSDKRLRGSMIAVLERSLPFTGTPTLTAKADGKQWNLAGAWWLVIRQSVFDKWQKAEDIPVKSARILVFDRLAEVYGSRQQFDQMVQRVVGSDFARRWGLDLNDP